MSSFAVSAPVRPRRPIGPLIVRLYLVETATPGHFELSETGPEDEAVIEQVSPGVYETTDSPGAGARAAPFLIGDLALVLT